MEQPKEKLPLLKRKWFKITLIAVFAILVIIGIIAGVRAYKKAKEKKELKKVTETKTTTTKKDSPKSTPAPPAANQNPPLQDVPEMDQKIIPFNQIKVGMILHAKKETPMFSKALDAPGTQMVFKAAPGKYLGKVETVTSGGMLKVRNYAIPGSPISEYFIPPGEYIEYTD